MPARYHRERRGYEGGRPLPRLLLPAEITAWAERAQWVSMALPRLVLGDSVGSFRPRWPRRDDRLQAARHDLLSTAVNLIARATNQVRQELGRPALSERAARANIMSALRGHRGLTPDKVFEFGEALFEAGLDWASGLNALMWAPTYIAHGVGLVGVILRKPNYTPNWSLTLTTLTRWCTSGPYLAGPERRGKLESYPPHVAVPDHVELRAAWLEWTESREDDAGMPIPIREYLNLCRARADMPLRAASLQRVADDIGDERG